MIRLAVCDDDINELESVNAKIDEYLKQRNFSEKFCVSSFSGSQYLLYEIEDGHTFDVYILDVEMPEMDGLQLAEKIRKQFPNTIILFLTSYAEYATEGYRVRALRYIYKMRMEEKLFEALDCAITELGKLDESSVTLKHFQEFYRIPYKDILYVQRVGRHLDIVTSSEDKKTDPRGISEFLYLLNDERFICIDRSCFVNIDYIKSTSTQDVTMTNGDILPISRRMLQDLKSTIAKKWGVNK